MRTVFAACLIACALAIPTPSVGDDDTTEAANPRKAVQKQQESPMSPFLEIMKEALSPNAEMKGFLDKAMGHHDSGDSPKKSSGDSMDQIMIKTAMAMATMMNSQKDKDGNAPDPIVSFLSALESGLESSATGPNADPVMKLAHTGIKMLIQGEQGKTINPFQLLLEIVAPDGKPLSEDPIMELMTNAIKAAAEDKSGDPLQAMVSYVLEDPATAKNPVVMMAKTMMTLFPQVAESFELPPAGAKKH